MPSVTDWISAASSVVSAAGILAAGWWFLETNKRKQRVQFDLDCRFFRLPGAGAPLLAEIWFVFENRGFIEHRLYDLRVSVHAAVPHQAAPADKVENGPWLELLGRESIVPKATGYYFVRPGVQQVIRHVVSVDAAAQLIRVTASFDYHRGDRYPHTARRIFAVNIDDSITGPGHPAA